jgi:hypothetical protein
LANVKRGLVLVTLLFVAAACGRAAVTPAAQARAELTKCRVGLAAAHLGPVTAKTVSAEKRRLAVARSACGAKAKLQGFARADMANHGLSDAADAEIGIADGLVNYGKYLTDIAAGKTGHTKILSYSLEEIRQAKILLIQALAELK